MREMMSGRLSSRCVEDVMMTSGKCFSFNSSLQRESPNGWLLLVRPSHLVPQSITTADPPGV